VDRRAARFAIFAKKTFRFSEAALFEYQPNDRQVILNLARESNLIFFLRGGANFKPVVGYLKKKLAFNPENG
jgi:hypothetical protein